MALLPAAPKVGETEAAPTTVPEEKTEVTDRLDQLKKTLAAKGVEDKEILDQLSALETVQLSAKDGSQPVITHKTLNQLQKAEKQFAAATTQLQELDEQWKKWSLYMQQKYTEQGKLYKEKRKAAMDRTKELGERLRTLRQEMQQAAQQQGEVVKVEEYLPEPEVPPFQEIDMILSSSDDEAKKRPAKDAPILGSSPAKQPRKT